LEFKGCGSLEFKGCGSLEFKGCGYGCLKAIFSNVILIMEELQNPRETCHRPATSG